MNAVQKQSLFACSLHERLCILYPSCHGEDFRSVYGVDQNADMGERVQRKSEPVLWRTLTQQELGHESLTQRQREERDLHRRGDNT